MAPDPIAELAEDPDVYPAELSRDKVCSPTLHELVNTAPPCMHIAMLLLFAAMLALVVFESQPAAFVLSAVSVTLGVMLDESWHPGKCPCVPCLVRARDEAEVKNK